MTDSGHNKPDLHVVGDTGKAAQSAVPDVSLETRWTSRQEWIEDGIRLGERVERDRWALGDWVVHGSDLAYGDLTVVAAEIGVAVKTMSNLASVARKIEASCRRKALSWAHHAEVACLPVETGDQLLDRAEAGHWPRERMREEARAASRVGRLEAENREQLAEIARLRQKRDPDNLVQIARETVERTLVRMKAEGRVVKEATTRASAMFGCLGADEIAGNIHGNKRGTLARDSARAFGSLSAQVRTARADAAPTIERIAKSHKSPTQACVDVLMDDIGEALREVARRVDAAELDPDQAKALSKAFDVRMEAIGQTAVQDVHGALDRKLTGDCQ